MSQKLRAQKFCDVCKTEINSSSFAKHLKSKSHLNSVENNKKQLAQNLHITKYLKLILHISSIKTT